MGCSCVAPTKPQYVLHESHSKPMSRTMRSPVKSHLPVSDCPRATGLRDDQTAPGNDRAYLESPREIDGGFYFGCDHGKHRNATRYDLWCNLFFLPSLFGQVRGGETKVTPKIVLFSKSNLTIECHCTNKVEPPRSNNSDNQ